MIKTLKIRETICQQLLTMLSYKVFKQIRVCLTKSKGEKHETVPTRGRSVPTSRSI
jgi:hypothetical protein